MTIKDVIPTGMTYVSGSGRWSVSGSTALTDASGGDPSGMNYDYHAGTNTVTAVVASIPAGQSGTVTFRVNVNSGLSPQIIPNTASFWYDPGTGTVTTVLYSNTVEFRVSQAANVDITGQTIASAPQSSSFNFTNVVTNLGNGTDSFDITFGTDTFPAGTTFVLYKSDGVTPLVDTTGNSVPDTGPLATLASTNIIVRVNLPTSASGGGPYTLPVNAISYIDSSVTDTANDVLTTIQASTVDVTNDNPVPTGTGDGTGPEVNPVTTIPTDPGTTARFTLYVNNTSGVADTYNLAASTDSSFATLSLPSGWAVVFRDSNGAIITSTGVVNAGANKLVYADVSVPASYQPGTVDIYFRALSPTTGALDRKHDAVSVNTVRRIAIAPNNTGQVSPGGSAVYSHLIYNNGNVLEGDGVVSTVSLTTSNSLSGWTTVLYHDADNNGSLGASDPIIANLNSVGGLSVGGSTRILVKVFAPSGAPIGAVNSTTIVVTTANGTYTTTVPAVVSATDTTTVISGDLIILKEQVLDANCDGTEVGYNTSNITTGAIPGACVLYRLTVTNSGNADATSVVVSDSTPAYTTYAKTTLAASTTVGSVLSEPADGAAGTFQFNIGTLTPGATAVITFAVKIDAN